jgi:hypothetical protein
MNSDLKRRALHLFENSVAVPSKYTRKGRRLGGPPPSSEKSRPHTESFIWAPTIQSVPD